MPSEDTKLVDFNQYQKSDKTPFIIYADLECLIENTDGCKNNPENSSTTKVGEDIPSGKYYMKKFSKSFREHPIEINNFKKKKK